LLAPKDSIEWRYINRFQKKKQNNKDIRSEYSLEHDSRQIRLIRVVANPQS
jgi:hypothetical protein